jgi:Flp pilus assembly protein TadD
MTEEFPDLPEPYNNLAVLHAADGQLDRARTLLESALRLDPGYRVAHENLGDVFVRLALRAYEAAAGPRSGAPLQSKLALTRQLAALR